MKITLTIALTLVMFGTLTAAYAQQYQDVIYLEHGSIIRGIIIETIPNHTVKIQTLDNSVFVCEISDIKRITKEPVQDLFNPTPNQRNIPLPPYVPVPREKSPFIAGACSFVVLGAGQAYNAEYEKALGHWLVLVGAVALIVQNEYDNEDLRELGAVILVANWVWSIIDAGVSAHESNEENRRKFRQPRAPLEFSKNIRANPIISRKQVGASLTLRW